MTALEELVAACEREFCSPATEAIDPETDERTEPDESEVALPGSHITFGMIRQARAELSLIQESFGGCAAIALERGRQITIEGWSAEHDDEHTLGELAIAAACYALQGTKWRDASALVGGQLVRNILWPWDDEWFKPTQYPDPPFTANVHDELRIRDLTKAGALIAADIDRLLRITQKRETSS